ncbi:MAG: DUF2271 domain-containing protein [Bacteroidota bacterium]|nr:DUF2271 domain-containing protein [Bacteroidota bacterium]
MKQKRKIQILYSLFIGIIATIAISCSSNNSPSNPASTPGLTVSVLTSSAGGSYAPKHVVAIWIENSAGEFVKTLTVYAQARATYLTNWEQSSAGNKIDAVSGATQNTHGTITAHWNGTDSKGITAPDGTYRICMELTDKDSTGSFSYFTFTKGSAAEAKTPANVPSFSKITIKWVPL